MPGIGDLDRDFIRTFQVIDGVIQRGQPLFGLVWLGSALALLAGLVIGLGQVVGTERILLAVAAGMYVLGVQLPTFTINVPLNNLLQAVDVVDGNEAAWRSARDSFEAPWNRWNAIRTVIAIGTTVILLILLLRI